MQVEQPFLELSLGPGDPHRLSAGPGEARAEPPGAGSHPSPSAQGNVCFVFCSFSAHRVLARGGA